ncbi:aldose 1-epimerase [Gimesia sp.]|uniref:aldose 1-epimerase n=1 Tax=Gimesia sp. TaxID=2024833 RepID=UPI000C646573|nr:aldose 1-epimerase [Gimesia sp.]MAX36050.1 aldose epimerase [Gimesia sp.]HAH44807.1 aldose 1-epimerase [Planctomycetaceae bacterium]HBL46614.1 aldose 1-epimerase [Planctomycetaceae bacterium]|tara:strand:- start:7340 stop:8305 length:966 start_codon:yes stop_codon:yes gene_type:complete
MTPIQIKDPETGSFAKILPELGFNCFEFQAMVDGQPVDVIDAHPDFASGNQRPSSGGIPILFPFPNRIAHGQFQWDGVTYELPADKTYYDKTGNAIHGFCLDLPWRVISQEESSVTGQFQLSIDGKHRLQYWPGDIFIEVRYEVKGTALRAEIRVGNPGTTSIPWGLGTHPYFKVPLSQNSEKKHCLVEAPASEEWVLENCVPVGVKKSIGKSHDLREGIWLDQLQADDILTGMPEETDQYECLIMDEKAGLVVTQDYDAIFSELVVFTPPDRDCVCLEPYTCVTNAINLLSADVETGLRVLPPESEIKTWIEIRAGKVLV